MNTMLNFKKIAHFTENKMIGKVGDAGFEPVTSPVCKRHKMKPPLVVKMDHLSSTSGSI